MNWHFSARNWPHWYILMKEKINLFLNMRWRFSTIYRTTGFFFFFFFLSFSHPCKLMVFYWSLSDSKSPQVSRTRLSILAVLSNAVVWIVSTRPPNSKSSRPFNNLLITVPNAPITIGTIVTFNITVFHISFSWSLSDKKSPQVSWTLLSILAVFNKAVV